MSTLYKVHDHDYRIFIALHIVEKMKKVNTTERAHRLVEKFVMEIATKQNSNIHEIITDDDIEIGAILMLKQYEDMLRDHYNSLYQQKNWFERFLMRSYFTNYKQCIAEYKKAVEELCLAN